MDALFPLAIALAAGLLIGTERGWQARTGAEGTRMAGIRTFGLIGLLGGLWGLLGGLVGELVFGLGFVGFVVLVVGAHYQAVRRSGDVGITTATAGLITFILGALATHGYLVVTAAGAVVTAVLLSLKTILHQWLRRLEPAEWYGALKLLLISVVVLPVLPDRGYGPWQALNPYEIWWMVVLIAGISFAGYVAMRVVGTQRGLMLTALLGGMASSTAVTLNYARMARGSAPRALLAAGVIVASATMFPRILIEVAVVNHALLVPVFAPLAAMTLVAYTAALWLWRHRHRWSSEGLALSNPFRLWPAVQFGALLAAVMFLAEAFRAWLGETGIYAVSALSALADVDAITLSVARLAQGQLSEVVAVRAIVLAAVVNTLVKGGLVLAIAGWAMAVRVLAAFAATAVIGAGVAVWF